MDDPSTTSDTLDQADEEILTPTISDEAIEAAAGSEGGVAATDIQSTAICWVMCSSPPYCKRGQ
jgi:hypothetical protein